MSGNWMDELLDASYAPKYVDQRSEDWERIRAGRFTSSEIWKIMECGKRPMTPEELKARPKSGKGSATKFVSDPSQMSATGMTYIYQKVAEVLTGRPKPSSYAYPLIYGKEQEPFAVEYFEKTFGIQTVEAGFEPYTDHAGGSADRFIDEHSGLEIKCPFQSENQIQYLMLNDHFDLKRVHPDYYWQCVSLMLFTNRSKWHFCTFDDRMIEPKHKMTHIELSTESESIREDMDSIIPALEGAVKVKLETLAMLS